MIDCRRVGAIKDYPLFCFLSRMLAAMEEIDDGASTPEFAQSPGRNSAPK